MCRTKNKRLKVVSFKEEVPCSLAVPRYLNVSKAALNGSQRPWAFHRPLLFLQLHINEKARGGTQEGPTQSQLLVCFLLSL